MIKIITLIPVLSQYTYGYIVDSEHWSVNPGHKANWCSGTNMNEAMNQFTKMVPGEYNTYIKSAKKRKK
jgi:hypothetical protein